MKKRNLVAVGFLYALTFGIYPLIWFIKFHIELREATKEGMRTLGHVLLLLFTFGAYQLYWFYASGKRLAEIGGEDRAGLCLGLGFIPIVGFMISALLLQHAANEIKSEQAVIQE